MVSREIPIPLHFIPDKTGEVFRVEYEKLARSAQEWSGKHGIGPSSKDEFRISLIIVDAQNTFCIPGFELFVGGRTGRGAVDDNLRLCRFIYRNLGLITEIAPTMDTHQAMQIFHGIFFVNDRGEHPAPYTLISVEDIEEGRWKFNKEISRSIMYGEDYVGRHLLHYTRELRKSGKYELTIWPYHAMLGGIGHALVSTVEEAVFFHSIARYSQPDIHVKGDHPLTEHYSVLGPEVGTGPDGKPLSLRTESLFRKPAASESIYGKLGEFDAVIIAGQAKSHCVAWTIADLLKKAVAGDKSHVEKIYLLEDCTSPVVVPGAIDYTDDADKAFAEFSEAGMHVVRSTDPIETWPGIKL
ncbi:MAG: isochorismatase [Thermodesulfobacteriota bacterium]